MTHGYVLPWVAPEHLRNYLSPAREEGIRTQTFNRRSAPRISSLFVTASRLDFHTKQDMILAYPSCLPTLRYTTAAHRLPQRQRTNKRKRGGGIADEGRKTWGNPAQEVWAGPGWGSASAHPSAN